MNVNSRIKLKSQVSFLIHSQNGSAIIFFVAVLLPFLILAWILSFDVGGFMRQRRAEQIVAENAALLGAKGLPFIEEARRLARDFALANSKMLRSVPAAELNQFLKIDVTPQSITVAILPEYKLNLTQVLSSSSATAPTALNYIVSANAVVAPRDVVIFIDKSRYVAPYTVDDTSPLASTPIDDSQVNVWNGFQTAGYMTNYKSNDLVEAEESVGENGIATSTDPAPWREAKLFKRYFPTTEPYLLGKAMLFTQQCFNPAFSALKQAAIHTYDYLGNFPDNSVAVIAGPGKDEALFYLHPMIQAGIAQNATTGEGNLEYYLTNDKLKYFTPDGGASRVLAQHCLYTADNARTLKNRWMSKLRTQRESKVNPKYWLRPTSKAYFTFPDYSDKLNINLLKVNGRTDPYSRLTEQNSDYTDPITGEITREAGRGALLSGAEKFVTTREAIWAQAAHRDWELDFTRALEIVGSSLIDAPHRDDRILSDEYVKSVAYMFLGDLPHVKKNLLMGPAALAQTTGEDNIYTRDLRLNVNDLHNPDLTAKIFEVINQKLDSLRLRAADKNRELMIYVMIARHPGRFCPNLLLGDECPSFTKTIQALEEKVSQNYSIALNDKSKKALQIKFIAVPDVGSLAVEIPAILPVADRAIVLTHEVA